MIRSRPRAVLSLLACLSLSCNTVMQLLATPTPPPTATPTPSETPTPTRVPATPTPTATLTPEPAPTRPILVSEQFAFARITQNALDLYLMPSGCLAGPDACQVQDATRLTRQAGASYFPRWSPDLTRIAFLHQPAGGGMPDIWIVEVAGGQTRALTEGGVQVTGDLAWSADGQHLLYSAPQPDGHELDVYRLEVATGAILNLTGDSPVWDAFPAASPVDDRVAFVSDRVPAQAGKLSDEIWVMNGDGSDAVQLTRNGFDFEDGAPAWSPGGDRIAFHRFGLLATEDTPGWPSGLWVMNADGSDPRNLVEFTDLSVNGIVWSPDGEWIAFAYGSFDSNVEVWVVPAEGGPAVNLSNLPGNDTHITWAPDSRALLFTDWAADAARLYYAAIDGSDLRSVFEDTFAGYAAWMP